MLSRNSESSRAIPPELQIQRVLGNPYIPEFGRRVKGMGTGEALPGPQEAFAVQTWLQARDNAAASAERLLGLDCAKEQINRLLEPFLWHTVIVTATDWENFLNLRTHKDASPAIQKIAVLMGDTLTNTIPRDLRYGDWHLPLVGPHEIALADLNTEFGAQVSAGRCARSSYSTHNDPESANQSAERWGRLVKAGHWSPGEHPAQCMPYEGFLGNFRGWRQLRKLYANEAVFQG